MRSKQSAYVMARNKLIPAAEVHADLMAGPAPECNTTSKAREAWGDVWNAAFFRMMDTLAYVKGITTCKGLSRGMER
jgi:hypothetical protein